MPTTDLPKGIRNLIIINTLLLIWTGWHASFWYQQKTDFVFWFYVVETLAFCIIGPLMYIRNTLIYKISRPLIYAMVLGISLLLLMLIPKGILSQYPLGTIFNIVLIIYLVGARGYLNEGHVREFYGLPAVKESK